MDPELTELKADVFKAWTTKARDPDPPVVEWLTEGAPAGIDYHPTNVGVFPEAFEDPQRMLHQLIIDMEEELDRVRKTVAETIADADQLCGFVWTQLTDVQQEVNGVLYFDRSSKLPIETIRRIMQRPGADIATPQ